ETWTERRRHELERLRGECAEFERRRHEVALLREQLEQERAAVHGEKRRMTEKVLAVEQFRPQVLLKAGATAAADKRVQRLRRRWQTQNAQVLQTLERTRQALHAELTELDERASELDRRSAAVAEAEAGLSERLTAWEHRQFLGDSRETRLEHEL